MLLTGVYGAGKSSVAEEIAYLAAVAANYRRAGIGRFVLACFARDPGEVRGVREALGLPLRVVRLTVPSGR